MISEGQLSRGIHITSDVPIVAYAHIYESANSGATMLMPVGVWGYEYYTLSSRQYYTSASSSAFHVVAQHDSTWVEITPSQPSRGGLVAGQTYLVKMNQGDTYQVLGAILSGSEGVDLTGSIVRSIPNNQGECYSIGVFAGSTRTGIGCGTSPGSNGDLIIQQIFPSQAWGTKYALATTTNATGPNANSNRVNKYRILVKDVATDVRRNGTLLPKTSLIANRFYEFESDKPDYVESNKPVLVAQFMASSGSTCGNPTGDGDPEMFYLSPLEQAVKRTYFYRNITQAINSNYITLVVPTEGLGTLQIDGVSYASYPASEIYSYPHSLPGYTVVTKKWLRVAGASSVECESPFTGIVYGVGSVESYGYNLGTLVKNLNASSAIQNQLNTSGNQVEYTCVDAPFFARALLDLHPDSIYWHFSDIPGLTPGADSISRFPVAIDTTVVDGVTFYSFQVNQVFRMSQPGTYAIPYDYWHSSIEGCDKKRTSTVYLQVLPKHLTDFTIGLSGGAMEACEGETATFTGNEISQNGLNLTAWNWTINNGTANPITASGRIQSNVPFNTAGTYNIILNSVTADGCVSDTTKQVIVKPKPTVAAVPSVDICPGETPTVSVTNPVAGTTYYWYTVATGGTPIDSGTSITLTNPAIGATYYAEAVSNACISAARAPTTIQQLTLLATPVVTVASVSNSSVSFSWVAIPGALNYELVATVNGVASAPVTVDANTLTYTVGNLTPATTVVLSVKAIAGRACQASANGSASGATFIDQLYIPNAFTPNGDGLNDRLYVYSYVVSSMQMAIFNQWGEKVFESTNMTCTNNASCPGTGWDGRYNGKDAPMGVYMYVARFTLQNGTKVERKGAINLVR
jgi:gliding motility-associated-like protein